MKNEIYEKQMDRLFYALSDSSRRKILKELTTINEVSIGELGGSFSFSKQMLSKHLKVLELAGLVNKEKEGRLQKCSLNIETLEKVENEIQSFKVFWEKQLDGLEDFINKKNEINED